MLQCSVPHSAMWCDVQCWSSDLQYRHVQTFSSPCRCMIELIEWQGQHLIRVDYFCHGEDKHGSLLNQHGKETVDSNSDCLRSQKVTRFPSNSIAITFSCMRVNQGLKLFYKGPETMPKSEDGEELPEVLQCEHISTLIKFQPRMPFTLRRILKRSSSHNV